MNSPILELHDEDIRLALEEALQEDSHLTFPNQATTSTAEIQDTLATPTPVSEIRTTSPTTKSTVLTEETPPVTSVCNLNKAVASAIRLPVEKGLCWRCGYPNHRRDNCTGSPLVFCSRCGQVGIMSKHCPCEPVPRPPSSSLPPTANRPLTSTRPPTFRRPPSASRSPTATEPSTSNRPPTSRRPPSLSRPSTSTRPPTSRRPPSSDWPLTPRRSPIPACHTEGGQSAQGPSARDRCNQPHRAANPRTRFRPCRTCGCPFGEHFQ
ncbi:unnamed protein product [Ceutorhynchus assimilis]|uniref:CCHC-type domain-containing protein n=1 Tax=Ceutorhynchus assimilis TaxID=467358 RepID=A0A9N9MYB7_9CUCU|nr:unnamed protein product [Ceutorhynchus assimilis]